MSERYESFSSLNTYIACPQRYFLKYVQRLEDRFENMTYLNYGSCIHLIYEKFHINLNDMKDLVDPVEKMDEIFNNSITKYWDKSINMKIFPNTSKDLNNFLKWEKDRIQHYKKLNLLADYYPFSIEEFVKSHEHKLLARIDRIGKNAKGKNIVIDYKTSKKLPKIPTADNKLQAAINWITLKEQGIEFDTFMYLYTRHFPNPFLKITIDEKLIEDSFKIINNVKSNIKAVNFEKNEKSCYNCSQKHNCGSSQTGLYCYDEVINI